MDGMIDAILCEVKQRGPLYLDSCRAGRLYCKKEDSPLITTALPSSVKGYRLFRKTSDLIVILQLNFFRITTVTTDDDFLDTVSKEKHVGFIAYTFDVTQ